MFPYTEVPSTDWRELWKIAAVGMIVPGMLIGLVFITLILSSIRGVL
jgi:hypothetical protein